MEEEKEKNTHKKSRTIIRHFRCGINHSESKSEEKRKKKKEIKTHYILLSSSQPSSSLVIFHHDHHFNNFHMRMDVVVFDGNNDTLRYYYSLS